MKSIYVLKVVLCTAFSLVLCLYAGFSVAQTNTFPSSGNVGIGTLDPDALLHVVYTNKVGVKTLHGKAIVEHVDAQLDLISSSQDWWGSGINFVEGAGTSNVDVWSITRQTTNGLGDSSLRFNFGQNNGHANPNKMTLTSSGSLGIGTLNPTSKLDVNGAIRTKEVNVTATGWPDYVFEKSYHLTPLEEVQKFYLTNGHLENIPTADEVTENGVNLSEMTVKLLEKVEELTIYLVEQNSKIKALEEELAALKKL